MVLSASGEVRFGGDVGITAMDPYDPHRGMAPLASPHMNHGIYQHHPNHVGTVPDVHKRDKDTIYG